jgi:hypothetical protein
MATGEDVTNIAWEPPKIGDALGEVTIEHRVISDVTMPMKQDDARRLATRVFGDDKKELLLRGDAVHWVRGAVHTDMADRTPDDKDERRRIH